jgi:multidrug resistance efflux pump
MTPDEQNLDMLVAELDRENRLLRARNERLEREAEQREPLVELTRNERMSYEELEIDRDRMKTARDALLLKNADLNANQRKPWVGLTNAERNKLWREAIGWGDPSHDDIGLMIAIEAILREKNQ